MNLYKHQEDALQQTKEYNRCAYYMDMGLGKTFVGAEKLIQLGKQVNLVVCQKSKVQDWLDHFKNQYPAFLVFNLTETKEFTAFIADLKPNFGFKVGIINYELAWRRKELSRLEDFTLMLDESSLIQNSKAKQTKFIMKLKPKNVILLSGSPVGGKYENLWTQLKLLGYDISERVYNEMYVNWETVNMGGVYFKRPLKSDPYKNIDRLKRKLREHGSIFMKTEEVFDLPKQVFQTINVDKSSDLKRFEKNRYLLMKDGTEIVGENTLTDMLGQRQLCSIYSKEKQDAFKDILDSTNDRLVVFYNFKAECELLKTLCNASNRPVSVVNGSVKDLFNYNSKNDSVTLVQYQSGAMGLNLQLSNRIVFYSPTLRCEHWMQSLKRIHRIGQERTCFYYKLVVKGSVETRIYQALERGVDYTNELFEEETKKNKKNH